MNCSPALSAFPATSRPRADGQIAPDQWPPAAPNRSSRQRGERSHARSASLRPHREVQMDSNAVPDVQTARRRESPGRAEQRPPRKTATPLATAADPIEKCTPVQPPRALFTREFLRTANASTTQTSPSAPLARMADKMFRALPLNLDWVLGAASRGKLNLRKRRAGGGTDRAVQAAMSARQESCRTAETRHIDNQALEA